MIKQPNISSFLETIRMKIRVFLVFDFYLFLLLFHERKVLERSRGWEYSAKGMGERLELEIEKWKRELGMLLTE